MIDDAWKALARRHARVAALKCDDCGRFISFEEMTSGRAKHYFEPDSDLGPEISEWTCSACVAKLKETPI